MKYSSPSPLSKRQIMKNLNQWFRKRLEYRIKGKEYIFTKEDFEKISGAAGLFNELAPRGKWKKAKQFFETRAFGTPEQNKVQVKILPLNAPIKDQPNAVLPRKMIDDVIDKSSFRVILNECICRRGTGCKDFPIDFGCLFIGEGARNLLRGGVAREATKEEAKAHIQKAADMKLVPIAAYVKIEQWVMGLSKENHNRLLEICLCCPCCCIGFHNFRHITPEFRRQVFKSVGFVAKSLPTCQGCFECVSKCPAGAIRIKGDKVWVKEDECVGCGICQNTCPHKAIRLIQISPSRGGILDYFDGLNLTVS